MTKPSRQHTQWAAQFAVASELCKRGYDVAFTAGNNTPAADLFVRSPTGHPFMVEVKGLRGRNFWLIKDTDETLHGQELYYVLAYVPPDRGNEFFILKNTEMIKRVHEWKQRAKWPSRS